MSQAHRTVLVIDDVCGGIDSYRHLFQQFQHHADVTYRLLAESTDTQRADAIANLCQAQAVDVILLDLEQSPNQGLDWLTAMQQTPEVATRPVIVIGSDNVDVAVRVLKLGAADYWVKERLTPAGVSQSLHATLSATHPALRPTPGHHQPYQCPIHPSEQRLRRVLDSLFSFVGMLTPDGVLIEANQTALSAAALDLDAVLGLPFEQTYWWAYAPAVQARLKTAIAQAAAGETVRYDARVRLGPERFIMLDFAIVPLRDQAGRVEYLIPSGIDITERKQFETSLKDNQAQLQQQLAEIEAIYQTAPIGLNVLDPQMRFVRINQRLAEINGLPVDAHLGRSVRELLPDLADTAEQLLRPVLETGKPLFNVEIQGETPARPGVKRTWIEHFVPLKDGDQVIGISTVCEEITDRKQAEAALRQSEERFRNMADNAPMMVRVTNVNGDCTYISQSWCEFTGQSATTGLGWGWLEAVHPDDRWSTRARLLEANQHHAPLRLEYRLRRSDGDYRWMIDAASPWQGRNGEFQGYIGSVIDISDRKQAELVLQEAHIQMESALAAGAIYTWRWDIAANRVLTDGNFARLFGVDPAAAAVGLPVEQFIGAINADDRPRVVAAIDRAIATGADYAVEYRIHDADGDEHWVIARGRVEYDANGSPVAFPGALADITARKQAEADLRKNAARLEFTLAASQFGTWEVDLSVPPYEAFPRSLRHDQIYGYDHLLPEWDFDRFIAHVHPDDRAFVAESFWRSVTDYTDWEIECRIIRADQAQRWVWISGNIYRNTDGQPTRLIGLLADITSRKQTEWALQQTTKRLNIALKSTPIVLFNQDRELYYTWIYNPGLGFDPEEVVGQQDADLVSPESAAYLTRLKQQVLDTGRSLRQEVKVKTEARTAYYDLTIDPIWNEQNQPAGVTCAAVDISDRKRTEKALRHSEDRLRIAIESAELGTWDWNLMTNEIACDAGCKAIFGLPESLKCDLELFFADIPDADRKRLEQAVQQSCEQAGDGDFNVEYRKVSSQGGTERWIAARGQVYFNAAGKPKRLIGAVVDITERKQAEAQREQLLRREQAARKSAEQANRVKDEFLAILSHELRTPLNPILGWSKMLQTGKLNHTQAAKALATIERNAKLQTQLIDDLLDVARILRGKLHLESTAVNLIQVVEAAMETVRTAAAAKSIALQANLPDIGQVWGDAARLQQVVWNLLSNAIKFTPPGGQVEICLERHGDQAHIVVKDTGKGISPDFLPYLFATFRQEDISTTREYGGLGLGLTIVRQLSEAHGGAVFADSPGEGQGATFTVQLPLYAGADTPLTVKPSPSELDLTGICVLAVDDDPDARDLLETLLSEYGAEVLVVDSAARVLVTLPAFQPDVLVSDIGMPHVDGYALLRQIRALSPEQGGQVPAIALTAYAREDDQQQAFKSGYQRHIAKPIDVEKLVKAIATLA